MRRVDSVFGRDKATSNGLIYIKHVCALDMDGLFNKITVNRLELFAILMQEFGAVAFNLICSSRLGDRDYYYAVTGGKAAADASYISNASLSSMFVLFLTLHVFRGPFLNFWLVVVDYICIKTKEWSEKNPKEYTPETKILLAILIFGIHAGAVGFAYGVIPDFKKDSKSLLTWSIITNANADPTDKNGYAFLEEGVAVTSLLVGFLYISWLRPEENDKKKKSDGDDKVETTILNPKVDIEFFIRLTLIVTACKRAFPTAHLSPHVSTYLCWTGDITVQHWGARIGGGVVAIVVVVMWDKLLLPLLAEKIQGSQSLDQQGLTSPENPDSALNVLVHAQGPEHALPASAPTWTGRGRGKSNCNFGGGSSLSISFAKPGIYY